MTENQEAFQKALNEGHSAAWDQLWEKAASCYRQALKESPNHPIALTSLGLALYELQKFDESLAYYQQAAKVTPNDPLPPDKIAQICQRTGQIDSSVQASLRAADLYMQNREVEKAIENWNRVTRLKPENMTAHSRLAFVYERIGQKDAAAMEYLAVASLLQSAKEFEKTYQAVSYAVKLSPDNKKALQAVQILRANQNLPKPERPHGATGPIVMAQVKKLEADEKQETSPHRQDPIAEAKQKALIRLAEILFDLTDITSNDQNKTRNLQSIVSGTGNIGERTDQGKVLLYLSQAVDLQTKGYEAQAAEELERAAEAGIKEPAVFFDLGYLKSQGNHPDSAMRYLQRAAKHPDYALATHLLMAKMLLNDGQLNKAACEYMEALRVADVKTIAPEFADELFQLYEPVIESLAKEKDKQSLTAMISNIEDLLVRPAWKERVALGREQLPAAGKGSAPLPLSELLIQSGSSQIVEAISKIREMARQGHVRTAIEDAHYALELAPTYLPLHSQIGELLIQQQLIPEAIEKFRVVAQAYNVRGEALQAGHLLQRIVQLAPMDISARIKLIELLMARGQIEEAIQEYMGLADSYYNLAELDKSRETYTLALRLAQQTRTEHLWSIDILYRMADIDMQRLDFRQALRVFEQIRTIKPDDERARTNLISLNFRLGQESQAISEMDSYVTYLVSNGNNKGALAFLEGISREEPERISVMQRLVDRYLQMEKIAEAIAMLDKLGEMALNKGDRDIAIVAVRKILQLNPPNAADYQKFLNQLTAGN